MKKIIPLSIISIVSLYANEIILAPVNVETTYVGEVSQNAKVSADLAQALSKSVPSIDMSRRSGIANDIFIRGQKRDNISIEVDGTKICGACPNRMDPPVSHVLASQIESIEVIEGPFDVTTFGNMSGGLKIKTKQPSKTPTGEINLGYGSWDYNKIGATFSGGTDKVRVLVSGSFEQSDQYKDGNGNTLAEQTKLKAPMDNKYQTKYEDEKAYKKHSVQTKLFINPTENQELQLGYTLNRSDDILYANTPMDAAYDDSNIYNVVYTIKNLTENYKDINLQYYYSDVDHPMDTKYRRNADPSMYGTNHLKTSMQGLKLKNNLEFDELKVLVGADASRRTWKGHFYNTDVATETQTIVEKRKSQKTQTDNIALFSKLKQSFGDLDLEIGARYDATTIETINQTSQDYNALSANLITTYNLSNINKIFLGIGQAYRVPDARELNFDSSNKLNQTRNQEIDLGYELNSNLVHLKIKGFYSMLDDYIYYYNKDKDTKTFTNIDAAIYGTEISASLYATDELTFDMGVSYKKGKKDKALVDQTNKNLADIAPLRANIGASYEYMPNSIASIDMQFSDRWNRYDSDNGEQEIASWSVLNAKVKHAFNKNFDFTLGINNILDKTYAQSNTYVDLKLLSAGAETMMLNEPGRYIYTNLDIKF